MLFCLLKWDHPRIRGKHSTINPSTNLRLGSPTHTREAPSFPSLSCSGSRITTAYAGSTASVGFGTCVCNYVPIFQSIRFDDKEPVNLESIVHPQILDDVERKYLSAVIKPFRNKVKSISKGASEANQEFIVIDCKNGDETFLPWFKAGTMYKGMERYKKYTLEELGL